MLGASERRIRQEDAGVDCAGVGLAEGGEVYRPLGSQVCKIKVCGRRAFYSYCSVMATNSKGSRPGDSSSPLSQVYRLRGDCWTPFYFKDPPFCKGNPRKG